MCLIEDIENKSAEALVLEFFKSDEGKARRWWFTPNSLFGGRSPSYFLLTGRRKKVEKFVRNQLLDNCPCKKDKAS
jgi:hypothetical protein